MRPLWKGTIGFGLVTIPVKLYSAVQESELDLDMLDRKDQARIRFQRINEETGKEVPYERIVKAFDLDGKYVLLDDKDFKAAAAEQTEVIAIKDFVKEEEVEGKYYEKPYYLAPDRGGARAYALLREALKKSGKVGVASFVMRTKEHPAVLQPDGAVLILNQMRFAQELRDVDELDLPKVEKVSPDEMKLAMQLIGDPDYLRLAVDERLVAVHLAAVGPATQTPLATGLTRATPTFSYLPSAGYLCRMVRRTMTLTLTFGGDQ